MRRRFHSKVPLISHDVAGHDRLARHLSSFGSQADYSRTAGRQAIHDRISMCLLRKDLESALPARREIRIARNRFRLKCFACLCVIWWLAGRVLLS